MRNNQIVNWTQRPCFCFLLLISQLIQHAQTKEADSNVFLMPQDFDLAATERVHTPTPDELDAIQNHDLFEGDILGIGPVTDEFANRRMRDEVVDEERIFGRPHFSSLNVETYADKLWLNGRIPYLLEEGMGASQRAAIAQAFLEYKDKTCINFSPKESDDHDYIYIKRNIAAGCSSYVGRAGGNQTVSLEVVKCFSKGIIAHELMHAIGFFHEHSRTDRDDYVIIDEKNVRPGMLRNFEKYPRKVIDPLGMPYDYESIMHYHKLAFSRNGRPTIVPRNVTAEIGQRYKLSEVDARKINKLYKCDRLVESANSRRPNQPTSGTTTAASTTTPTRGSRLTTSEETSRELTSSMRGSSVVTVSPQQPPTLLFTRVTSDRWKYLTDRTTTPRPRTSRLPVESSEEKTRTQFVVVDRPERECKNLNAHCEMWERLGHCEHSAKYMRHYCRRACGLCTREVESEDRSGKRLPSPSGLSSRGVCVDKNLFCGYWSRIGECRSESKFMRIFCRRSCGLC